MPSLELLGWCRFFERQIDPPDRSLVPARVLADAGGMCFVHDGADEVLAVIPGRLRHAVASDASLPVAGDWVLVRSRAGGERAVIVRVLDRRTVLARKEAGERTSAQLLGANVDTVFVVQGLDGDFNPRRLERYLIAVRSGGAAPVVVLNKVDLRCGAHASIAEVARIAEGAPVHAVSALDGTGMEGITRHLAFARTVALVGSSGVGKSTLLNRIAGTELQRVRATRASDGRGRHTTTSRRLVPLACGALLLDTPGMRELSPWRAARGVEDGFPEIERLARSCRFRDCSHGTEPDCAVREALDRGTLDPERVASREKLLREARWLERRHDVALRHEETRRVKQVHREMRRAYKK